MSTQQKKNEKNFLIQGSILAIAGVISKLIGGIYKVPLMNILGDEGMGYVNAAFSIYTVALMLTSYSLPLAVSKLVSARVARGEYRNANKVFRGAMSFALVAGGVVSLIIFLGAEVIAKYIMKLNESVYAIRVLAPCILVVAIVGVLRGFFQGNSSMVPTAVSQVLEQIVNATACIIGAYLLVKVGKNASGGDKSAAFGAAGGTVGAFLGALTSLVFLGFIFYAYRRQFRRKIRRDRSRRRESYQKVYKVLFCTIAPVILSATVYNIGDFIDSAMFSNIMAAQGVPQKEYAGLLGMFGGQYNTLINLPLSIASALAASLIPSLVATVQTGNRRQIHDKINSVLRFNMSIAIPCAVGFIIMARPILDLLFYTQDNEIPALMLRLGAVSVVFFCLSTVTNSVLQGLDDMMTPIKNAVISLVIHVAALFIMLVVFKWSIYAVILSKTVFSGAVCILNAHALRERIGYVQEQKKIFGHPLLASGIMAVVTLVVQLLFELFIGKIAATILALLMAVITYGVAMVLTGGVTEEEMLSMPKGATIVSWCRKLHLIRGEYR